MKLLSAAFALGLTASLAGTALADCPGHSASTVKPVTTASTVVPTTVVTDDKG